MNKVILSTFTRNHLRFLIPMVKHMCEKGDEVLLYTNFAEVSNDPLAYKINEYVEKYPRFYTLDSNQEARLIEYSEDAKSMLVTSGTSNQYHHYDFNLCTKVKCKTFAIQHGISQEGITRLPQYYFSADKVIAWIKEEHLHPDVTTPKEKFIFVGVPNHHYGCIPPIQDAKVFFFTNGFDKPNNEDIKLETSGGDWGGIYTTKWKEDTWDKISNLSDGPCYFVRHPTCNGGNIHPKLDEILSRSPDNHLVDSSWLQFYNTNRSQLFSLGVKYYVTNPSSCWIDCMLNEVDYEIFVDYNSNVDILLEDSLKGINKTEEICELLIQ
tara:strand:- start:1851 stop:2822 length:972 start_codon:yes stop_codon:yes gene_type:complete